MKLAIMSDIHSNKYALKEVFHFLNGQKIDWFIFLGDYFGYYPWAQETFDLLKGYFFKSIHILGNHDELIISPKPYILPEYWDVIQDNKSKLSNEAMLWLSRLKKEAFLELDGISFRLCHGTPDDNLLGRYYPDDILDYHWFPKEKEILLLGHTHYPIFKVSKQGGVIINPGSIGQSRDGNISATFCILDTKTFSVDFKRIPFQVEKVIQELEAMNWYPRAIKALRKVK